MIANDFDIGAHLKALIACQHTSAVAAGSGDAAYITGETIDLTTFAVRPVSCLLVAPWEAALTDTKKLSMKSIVQHDDASNMGTAITYAYDGAETALTVVKLATASTTYSGVYTRAIDLSGIKRYFRVNVYQDLDASGTDTNQLMAVLVFAPAGIVAQTQ